MKSSDFLFDLKGKNALVTGGSIGLGRACATALALGGANVAIVDINEKTGQRTVEDLKALGVDSFFIHCDVTDQKQIEAMVSETASRWGRLDIAINNAGIIIGTKDQTYLSKEDWDKVLAVDLTGVWLCAQAEAQQMIQQSPTAGKIINIASLASKAVTPLGSYDASKAGVVQLTRNLAVHWGRYNINVNCFSPGVVMTSTTAGHSVEMRQQLRNSTPMRYLQRPEDLYGPIRFLASSASNYMTGHEMVLDGGYGILNHGALLPELEEGKWDIPPLVSPEEEVIEMKKDLDAMGIDYDEYAVVPAGK